jgi:tetratricopeptide (TPR) repeat protein
MRLTVRKKISTYIGALVIAGGVVLFFMFNLRPFPGGELSPSSAGDYLAGYFAAGVEDFEEASAHFKKSLGYDRANKKLLIDTYNSMVLAGQLDDALKLAHHYVPKGTATLTGSLMLALPAVRDGDYVQAGRIIEQNGRHDNVIDKLIVPYIIAWCKAGSGNSEEALVRLRALMSSSKDSDAFVQYELALINDMVGNSVGAEKYYDKAISNSEKSYRFIKNTGNFYERIGKKDRAKLLYEEYDAIENLSDLFAADSKRLEINPAPPKKIIATAREGIVDVLLEIVGSLYKNQLYREALSYLEMILYLDADNAQAHFLLGSYYEQNKLFEKALYYYKKIGKDTDFYWQAQLNIAQSYYKRDDAKRAKKILISLYSERPNDLDAPLLLCDILKAEGNFKGAAEIYDKVIASLPKVEASHWNIYYMRAMNYEQAGMWDRAEADLYAALALQPNQADLLNYLGYSLLTRHKKTTEAREMIQKALDQHPDSPMVLDSMGWALYENGEYNAAQGYLEKALQFMPYDSTINEHVGDLYWRLGRKIEARFQWQHALSFSPEKDQVLLLERKLESGLPRPGGAFIPAAMPAPAAVQVAK